VLSDWLLLVQHIVEGCRSGRRIQILDYRYQVYFVYI
jgi:hypothetical protein